MGVRGLYHYCKPFIKPLCIENIEERVGIDASSILYRFQGDFDKIYEILKPFDTTKLLFVFDGKAPKYKEKELILRKHVKDTADIRINKLKESLNEELNNETRSLIVERIAQLEK